MYAIKTLLVLLLKLYQKTISPDHSVFKQLYPYGFCRFYPTCSDYAIQAIQKYPLSKSLLMIAKRVLKCNHKTRPKVDLP